MAAIMLGAGICLSLIMQIGEQIDYLRFMPAKTKVAKHGGLQLFQQVRWVILKKLLGLFSFTHSKIPGVNSTEPVQQFNAAFHDMLPAGLL